MFSLDENNVHPFLTDVLTAVKAKLNNYGKENWFFSTNSAILYPILI